MSGQAEESISRIFKVSCHLSRRRILAAAAEIVAWGSRRNRLASRFGLVTLQEVLLVNARHWAFAFRRAPSRVALRARKTASWVLSSFDSARKAAIVLISCLARS